MTWQHLIITKENYNEDKIIYFVLNHIVYNFWGLGKAIVSENFMGQEKNG